MFTYIPGKGSAPRREEGSSEGQRKEEGDVTNRKREPADAGAILNSQANE